tara:strand:+ start:291 stop:419 length:129 start_codon:yes stop_codon:yes gene_type:complete
MLLPIERRHLPSLQDNANAADGDAFICWIIIILEQKEALVNE